MDDVLVSGGRVLTLDDRATVLPRGDVLISDGLIAAVGPDLAALREAGIRAVFAHGWPIDPGGGPAEARTHPADIRRVRADLLPDDAALVTLAMGARGPDYAGLPATHHDLALAGSWTSRSPRTSPAAGSARPGGASPSWPAPGCSAPT